MLQGFPPPTDCTLKEESPDPPTCAPFKVYKANWSRVCSGRASVRFSNIAILPPQTCLLVSSFFTAAKQRLHLRKSSPFRSDPCSCLKEDLAFRSSGPLRLANQQGGSISVKNLKPQIFSAVHNCKLVLNAQWLKLHVMGTKCCQNVKMWTQFLVKLGHKRCLKIDAMICVFHPEIEKMGT